MNKTIIWFIIVILLLVGAMWAINYSPVQKAVKPPDEVLDLTAMTQKVLTAYWDPIVSTACGPARGNPKAEWTMVEIGDFQCPQCGKARQTVEDIVNKSQGHLKLEFLNWPLPKHANAGRAACAALAAEAQGKFWVMYDAIYVGQGELEEDTPAQADAMLASISSDNGLNENKLIADRYSTKIQDRLAAQVKLVTAINTQSTPTFLLRKTGDDKIYWFLGVKGQEPSPTTPSYPGLSVLAKRAPWLGGHLDDPADGPMVPGGAVGSPQPRPVSPASGVDVHSTDKVGGSKTGH